MTDSYRATRDFPAARSEEDYAMTHWASEAFTTRAEATQALAEHLLGEARSLLKLASSTGSDRLAEHALELSQLAGAIGTTIANDSDLEQVTASNGVRYSVRRIS